MNDIIETLAFNAWESDPSCIARKLKERGVVMLRGVLDRATLSYCNDAMRLNSLALNHMLEKEVNFLPVCFADRFLPERILPETLNNYNLEGFGDPISFSGMQRSWYYEGERQFKKWFWQNASSLPNILMHAVICSKLKDVFREYFGEDCVSPYEHDGLHYQHADIEHLAYKFHQDGSYFTRKPAEHNGLTAWIPFHDCGVHAPGLQVYPFKTDEVLSSPKHLPQPNMYADEEEVLSRFGEYLYAPQFKVGDCLVFDGFSIHRTYITPDMTEARQSADIRVFPKSRVPSYVQLHGGWMMNV